MRWKKRKPEVWNKWFAWHPVEIKDEWVWLETVERSQYASYGSGFFWIYRHVLVR